MTHALQQRQLSSTYTAIWGGLNAALVLSCLRAHGSAEAEAAELETGRRLTASWVDGEPWTDIPSALQACVRLQVDADRRKGRPVHEGESGGACWVAYPQKHWLSYAPQSGVTMPAVVSPGLQAAYYQSRHAEIARRVGHGKISFLLTHSLVDGDACDAGYFAAHADSSAATSPSQPAWLTDMSAMLDAPAGPDRVDVDQGCGTLAHEAGLRIHVLCERLGPAAGALVVEHALRILLTGYRGWLAPALGLPVVKTPRDAATLFARFWETAGAATQQGDGLLPRVSFRLADAWPEAGKFPSTVAEAIARAWSASLAHLDFNLRCWIVNPQNGEVGRFSVEFDAGGPCA